MGIKRVYDRIAKKRDKVLKDMNAVSMFYNGTRYEERKTHAEHLEFALSIIEEECPEVLEEDKKGNRE